uniref:PiggyBac transposable elementderived protein 2like [Oryzias latipes] n=1 Tax=Lepeophtheirus salmonis TaxID=72036 RepID=A0A0K2V9Y2_LEPSM
MPQGPRLGRPRLESLEIKNAEKKRYGHVSESIPPTDIRMDNFQHYPLFMDENKRTKM